MSAILEKDNVSYENGMRRNVVEHRELVSWKNRDV